MDVSSQIENLHATLTLVLSRLDALESSRTSSAPPINSAAQGMPEGNNFGDPDPPETLPKLISNQKEKLTAIPELKQPEEWPRFINQVMLVMDVAYPWIADWMQRIQQLSDRPNRASLHRIAQGMQLGLENNGLYGQFTIDL